MRAPLSWRPTFIGIGAAKCATTWCWEALRQHPDVDAAQPKEINFFNANFERGLAWYARHFAHPDRLARGEISPLYMEESAVAARIAATFPESTLLVVLRNPFARALSNVLHDVRDRHGGIADATERLVREVAVSDPKYVRRSLYAQCLEPFLQEFPASQLRVLFYEHLRHDALEFLANLYRAVGVDARFVPDHWQCAINRTQDYAWPRLFHALHRASQAVKAIPPTRAGLDWIYRSTRLREWALSALSVDRGRPSFDFEQIFGRQACELIHSDIERLETRLQLPLPPSWHTTAATTQRDAA